MHVTLWILAGALSAALVGAGISKLVGTRERLVEKTPYVQDFPQGVIRAIGAAEVAGSIGLVVPPLVGIAPALVPVAATGVAILMTGGAITHLRRGDGMGAAVPALVLAVVAAVVAWARFGPYAF